MKNLYLIALICITSMSAQDLQNANWIFGDNAWLDFNSSMVTPQTTLPFVAPSLLEGCASASDTNGSLLFWTNGRSVFRMNSGAAVTLAGGNNTLNGDLSSAQNVIIIPWPSHPGMYFLVTIAQESPITGLEGLYWSVVNTTTNTVTNLNTPLRDMAGSAIVTGYGMLSEAVTSVLAQNGTDYWLIAQVDKTTGGTIVSSILSYPITAAGIGNPAALGQPTQTIATNDMGLSLKVSPDRLWIGVGKENSHPLLGNFNPSNGVITNLQYIGNGAYSYSVEFSPDSQNMYFSAPPTGIYGIDLDDPANVRHFTGDIGYGLQRALNGRIYISRKGENFVSELQDPNNFSNPMYNASVSLNSRTAEGGFPQWLWAECIATLIDYNDIVTTDRSEERELWIQNYNYIADSRRAIYHAGNFVELLPDFEAEYGAEFAAYIEGCNGNSFEYKPGADSNPKTEIPLKAIDGIKIYPNPTNSLLNIAIENYDLASIQVNTIEGKMVFYQKVNGRVYQIDVSNFANGVYLISLLTKNGKTLNSKFIKN